MKKASIFLTAVLTIWSLRSFSQETAVGDLDYEKRLDAYLASCGVEIGKAARLKGVSLFKSELDGLCLRIKADDPKNASSFLECALEEKKQWSDMGILNHANDNLASCLNYPRSNIKQLQDFAKEWNNSQGTIVIRVSSSAFDYLSKYTIDELNSAVTYARQLAISVTNRLGGNRFGLPDIYIAPTLSVEDAIRQLRERAHK